MSMLYIPESALYIRVQVLGKWILHASISESAEVGERVKVIKSSWIEISDVPGREPLNLRWADRT